MKSWEVEKIFNEEVYQKKKTGRGVYNRASRRGYTGTIRTQSDYLTAKEKKKLNGEVKIMDLYNDIKNVPSIQELNEKSNETRHKILQLVSSKFSQKDLSIHWKTTPLKTNRFLSRNNVFTITSLIKIVGISPDYNKVFKYDSRLKTFPNLYQISFFGADEKRLLIKYACVVCTPSSLAKYWGISYDLLKKIIWYYKVDSAPILKSQEYSNLIKGTLKDSDKDSKIEQSDVETNNIVIEHPIEETQLENCVTPVENLVTPLQIKEDIIKYTGMQYSLSGIYNKEELKNLIPPTIGILVNNKKYEITFSIKEVVECSQEDIKN